MRAAATPAAAGRPAASSRKSDPLRSPRQQIPWRSTRVDFVGDPDAGHRAGDRVLRRARSGCGSDAHRAAEFWDGEQCSASGSPSGPARSSAPSHDGRVALHVADVAAARAELEAKGVEFDGEIDRHGVCHMAFFNDPDGNSLMLHHRYKPYERTDGKA